MRNRTALPRIGARNAHPMLHEAREGCARVYSACRQAHAYSWLMYAALATPRPHPIHIPQYPLKHPQPPDQHPRPDGIPADENPHIST